MKSFKKYVVLWVLVVANVFVALAQEPEVLKDASNDGVLKHLTPQQLSLLQEQKLLIDKHKADFKASMTEQQKAIFADRTLSRDARKKAIKASLNQRQLKSISGNRDILRNKKLEFRKTLSQRQRTRIRHFVASHDLTDRKRLLRRLKILLRDNLTDQQ